MKKVFVPSGSSGRRPYYRLDPREAHPKEPAEKRYPSYEEMPEHHRQEAVFRFLNGTKRQEKGQGREYAMSSMDLEVLLKSGKVRYALVSAGRNPGSDEEKAMKGDDPYFEARHKKLGVKLKELGYVYTPVKGHYGGEENSYLVLVHDANREEVTALGKDFNQESVIYSEGGKHQMIYTTGGDAGKYVPGNGFTLSDKMEDYYTEVRTSDGRVRKFSLNFPDFDDKRVLKSWGAVGRYIMNADKRTSIFGDGDEFLKSHEIVDGNLVEIPLEKCGYKGPGGMGKRPDNKGRKSKNPGADFGGPKVASGEGAMASLQKASDLLKCAESKGMAARFKKGNPKMSDETAEKMAHNAMRKKAGK